MESFPTRSGSEDRSYNGGSLGENGLVSYERIRRHWVEGMATRLIDKYFTVESIEFYEAATRKSHTSVTRDRLRVVLARRGMARI